MSFVATAVIGGAVIGGVLASDAQTEAASTAAGAQTAASEMSIEEQRRQFDAMQEMLRPYTEAGYGSLEQQQALLGMGGAEAQQAAVSGIEDSPYFQTIARQGEEAMLQQASATGGLRGGNIQGALAQYRPQLLNQLIEQQYGKLQGITQMGQASAAGVGAAGMQMAGNIGSAYGDIGAAQAGSALAAGQGTVNTIGGITGAIGTLGGMYATNPTMFSSGTGVNWGAF